MKCVSSSVINQKSGLVGRFSVRVKKFVMCVASLCDQSEVRAGWKIQCASKKVCDVCK